MYIGRFYATIFCEVERLYRIIFYQKSNGESPVLDYIHELEASTSKDSRIKRNQIAVHIKVLAEKGTIAGMPYMRHLDGEIWELRPIRDRILFAGVLGDAFVLLHSFVKKTQKTPKQEIEQAKRELQDFIDRGNEDERS